MCTYAQKAAAASSLRKSSTGTHIHTHQITWSSKQHLKLQGCKHVRIYTRICMYAHTCKFNSIGM